MSPENRAPSHLLERLQPIRIFPWPGGSDPIERVRAQEGNLPRTQFVKMLLTPAVVRMPNPEDRRRAAREASLYCDRFSIPLPDEIRKFASAPPNQSQGSRSAATAAMAARQRREIAALQARIAAIERSAARRR